MYWIVDRINPVDHTEPRIHATLRTGLNHQRHLKKGIVSFRIGPMLHYEWLILNRDDSKVWYDGLVFFGGAGISYSWGKTSRINTKN